MTEQENRSTHLHEKSVSRLTLSSKGRSEAFSKTQSRKLWGRARERKIQSLTNWSCALCPVHLTLYSFKWKIRSVVCTRLGENAMYPFLYQQEILNRRNDYSFLPNRKGDP